MNTYTQRTAQVDEDTVTSQTIRGSLCEYSVCQLKTVTSKAQLGLGQIGL